MKLKLLCVAILTVCFATFLCQPSRVANADNLTQTDPNTALSRGRALLKQGHADQALGYLESALQLFTQSNSSRGVAAAQDALGDLYLIQGQYKVALDHYQKSYEAFAGASSKDQTDQAAANSVASRAGSTAAAATETAGSAAANGFNANLMLAKIGDTNYRLGRLPEAVTAYAMMNVKKPESAAAKVTRRLGGLGGMLGSISTGNVSIATPTSSAIGLLETKKEFDEYRVAIVYMTYELGMGRIAFANNDLDTARKHFQNALESGSGALPVVAKLGQTRRFRTAARTSLGDVTLRLGKYSDAAKLFSEASKTARRRQAARSDVAGFSRPGPQPLAAGRAREPRQGREAARRFAHGLSLGHKTNRNDSRRQFARG